MTALNPDDVTPSHLSLYLERSNTLHSHLGGNL